MRWDDGSFWSNALLVAEYLASELGAPAPRPSVGRQGQSLLRMSLRGVADGIPAKVRFAADGQTEEGTDMEVSIAPERPWADLIGDALGLGATLSALVRDPDASGIALGGTRSLPSELDGGHVEVLRALDGALRVRVSDGRPAGHERPSASTAVTNVDELLRRACAREERVEGPGHRRVVYRGLVGVGEPCEVTLAVGPAKGIAGEMLIVGGGA